MSKNSNSLFSNFVSIILVICAVIVTTLVVKNEFNNSTEGSENSNETEYIDNWRELNTSDFYGGDTKAEVEIIEFFDYQCQYCKSVQPTIKNIKSKYGNMISISYAHFPLGYHKEALNAAIAAECARDQNQFMNYHIKLFEYQDSLGSVPYSKVLSNDDLLNKDSFEECLKNGNKEILINKSIALGNKIGIKSIPTFIINGEAIKGAVSETKFSQTIDTHLKK